MSRKVGIPVLAALLSLIFAASANAASFEAHGSMEQVYATGLPATTSVSLLNSSNSVVETKSSNFLGGVLFRNVPVGTGYQVRRNDTNDTVGGLTVITASLTSAAPPDASIYDPTAHPENAIPSNHSYGYMTTRDGTKLAYAVHPPTDVANNLPGLPDEIKDLINGLPPTNTTTNKAPTLVEYSGYGYAKPDAPVSGIAALANIMGFTVVDVNMRGTGCSGGAFDFFEPAQSLDGYDVVETVAHQPWVKNGKAGMLGISYGGISQLFTGQTQPPDLAALAPLSVIDQTQTTLYPGGVLNTGFAVAWSDEREHEALPVPASDPAYATAHPDEVGGQPYAQQKVLDGDAICKANQALHPEKANLKQKIRENDHYVPSVADPLAPTTFVDKINVPTFMACQWTDEQTGGHCPTLADKMLHGPHPDHKWFTFTNGVHTDSLDPATYNKLYDFLELYVAQQGPATNPFTAVFQATAPVAVQAIFGIDAGNGVPSPEATLPPDPIQALPNPVAQQQFEAQQPIRVLFDNGAGQSPTATQQHPGWPYSNFESSFSDWPIPTQQAKSWSFGPGGTLTDSPSATAGADRFRWDRHARPDTDFTGDTGSGAGGLWTATPAYNWTQNPDGKAVSYLTPQLSQDTAVIGGGAVHAWIRSSVPDVDLQATISEVRPDGKETFVQNGWVAAKARALDSAKSTLLEPVLSLKQEDFADMPQDQFTEVTIPLYYQGHMFRKNSRIRLQIEAPGGDQPIWAFDEADPPGQANIDVSYGGFGPSRLDLPVIPGVDAQGTALPPCTPPNGLRNEPCRNYVAMQNHAADDSTGNTGTGQGGGTTNGSGSNQGQTQGQGKAKCKKKRRKKGKHLASAAKKHKKHKKKCHKKHKKHKHR